MSDDLKKTIYQAARIIACSLIALLGIIRCIEYSELLYGGVIVGISILLATFVILRGPGIVEN